MHLPLKEIRGMYILQRKKVFRGDGSHSRDLLVDENIWIGFCSRLATLRD
jgi:hypothetical protein